MIRGITLLTLMITSSCVTARLVNCPDTFDLSDHADDFVQEVAKNMGAEAAHEARKVVNAMSFTCKYTEKFEPGDRTGYTVQSRSAVIYVLPQASISQTAASHEWAHETRRRLGDPGWKDHNSPMFFAFSEIEQKIRKPALDTKPLAK